MQIIDTNFNDVKLIKKELFFDNRGYFTEVFHQKKIIEKICKNIDFVQENESCSKKNTIRGLH
ncbi:dTDP-4-keto-6-deoxy-D-glucose epimerase, partial [Campylobacter coli]|nr:dTDP-4-keto-6-deoxy-D-glucose epimerase [Campylobacter coli]